MFRIPTARRLAAVAVTTSSIAWSLLPVAHAMKQSSTLQGRPPQSAAPAPAKAANFNRMTFGDEFTSLTTVDLTGTGAAGRQWFTDRPFGWGRTMPESLSVTKGVLSINNTTGGPNYGIATTSPTSKAGKGFKYGYFEARIAFDPAKATKSAGWPSFWGLSHNQIIGANYPRSVELDFFEAYHDAYAPAQNIYAGTLHDFIIGPPQSEYGSYGNNSVTMPGVDWRQFHTYGCLWQRGKVTWYFDGKAVLTQSYSADAAPSPNPGNLPSGTFGQFDSDQGGQTVVLGSGVNYPMQVDWVRVWQA